MKNTENITKLKKMGYKWVKVSQMFDDVPEVESNCCNKDKYPGYSGLWCRLIMAVTSYAMMKNTVAVIHGPKNCAWAVRNFCQTNYCLYYGNPFLHMPVTDINQNDVISGASEKLINTLKEVDKNYKPEHICVFDTCSTSLIADDVENSIKAAQSEISAKIDYMPSAGFISPPLGKSITESTVRYAEMMEAPDIRIDGTVNILGTYKEQQDSSPIKQTKCGKFKYKKNCSNKRGKYLDDASELTRLIESIGLNVHRVLVSGPIDYIKTAPQASINVISCPTWGLPLAKKMKEKFGTPYLSHSVPTGVESTKRWIRDLAFNTGKSKEAEAFINKELEEVIPVFEKAKNLVSGKVALIECGRNSMTAFARPMALARALQELGMKPYLFGLHPIELKSKGIDLDYFLWDGYDPMILNGNYHYQQPLNISYVVDDLGLKPDEYVYFTQDVFPMAKAGDFDPSIVTRVETGVHLRRVLNAPGRGVGFRGAKALYENIIESVMFAGKQDKCTLYGRVHGKFYNFS